MRAAVFQQVGLPLSIETVPDPTPGPGQVVLTVGRCGICGSDLHSTDGHGLTSPPGYILGHEYAGEVVALGAGVEKIKIGDRLAVVPILGCGHCAGCLTGNFRLCPERRLNFGGFAEYAISGERECIHLPRSLSLADGALVEPLAVAIHGVRRAGIKPNSHVLVLGAGPVGLAAIFWARRLGASRIDVLEISPERSEKALAMGADQCTPPPPSTPINLDDLVNGDGSDFAAPDIVMECTGVPGLIGQAIKHVRPSGHILVLGFCAVPETIVPAIANMKEVTIDFSVAWNLDDFEVSARALDAGFVEPRSMITETIVLDRLPVTFEDLRTTKSQCKVLIDPWRSDAKK